MFLRPLCSAASFLYLLSSTLPAQNHGEAVIFDTVLNPSQITGAGAQFASAGDLNADGIADFLSIHKNSPGRPLDYIRAISGSNGEILGSYSGSIAESFGASTASGIDFDGDGHGDILIGAPTADTASLVSPGVIYAYSGADSALLFRLEGQEDLGSFGSSLSMISDVDGDGTRDFAVGAHSASVGLSKNGAIYIFSGATQTLLRRIDGTVVDQRLGIAMVGFSDLDGDGLPEIAVADSPRSGIRLIHLFQAATGVELIELDLDISKPMSLAQADDLDGDGYEDLLVGVPFNTVWGSVYVVSGATGETIHRINSPTVDSDFAVSMSTAGDMDDDGFGDILVGAPQENGQSGLNVGAAYLFSGRTGEKLGRFEGFDWDDWFGSAVFHLDDYQGKPVLLFGAPGTDRPQFTEAGAISFGNFRPFLRTSTRSLSVSTGGTIDFGIDFTPDVGRQDYRILMSPSVGYRQVQGLDFHLGASHLLFLTKNAVYPFGAATGLAGQLSSTGDASGSLAVAPGELSSALVGSTLWVAALALDKQFGILKEVSSSIPIEILP